MACDITITPIQPTEYIGNSLDTINTNFANLRDGVKTNCTNILSATDVVGTLRTIVTTLQDYAQGRPKAWVVFDGTRDVNGTYDLTDGNDRQLIASYNIVEVYRISAGIYDVYFADSIEFPDPPPGELPAYAAIATSSTVTAGSYNTWAQITDTEYQTFSLRVVVNDGQSPSPNYADSTRVTVAIF